MTEQIDDRSGPWVNAGTPRGTGRGFHVSQVALALIVLVLPAVAVAHARLVRSWPANGATVALAPGELRLCFNELLERQFHAIELGAEDGATGRWEASAPPGPVVDTYGAGDVFMAALTLALGEGLERDAALARAARSGAAQLTRRGGGPS